MLLYFRFRASGFEATPHPSCYLTSILNKTHHGTIGAPFLCNFCSFFSYARSVLESNTRGAFAIIFMICSDLKQAQNHFH